MALTEKNISPGQQMIASCSGAIITSLLMTPFDVVKVRIQAQQASVGFAALPSTQYLALHPGKPCRVIFSNGLMDTVCELCGDSKVHFTGTMDAFMKIARTEGVTSLWRGLVPTLFMSLPSTMIYFTSYDMIRGELKTKLPDVVAPLVAGATARCAVALISPMELFRTKAQSQDRMTYRELGLLLRIMVRTNGMSSLWRGLSPTLWRDVPFSAIYWASYETIKRKVFGRQHPPAHSMDSFFESFVCGGVSGAIAAVITMPFDVIKTYQQIDLTDKKPMRMTTVWSTIIRKRGYPGLMAGLVPRVAKVAPACAIMIGSYEAGKAYFGRMLDHPHK